MNSSRRDSYRPTDLKCPNRRRPGYHRSYPPMGHSLPSLHCWHLHYPMLALAAVEVEVEVEVVVGASGAVEVLMVRYVG